MKYIIQLTTCIFILIFSTFVALYEGSEVVHTPWEWGYSTPFSQLLNVKIVTGQEISQLDYFVYAAKYAPLYPLLMLISIGYMGAVAFYALLKCRIEWGLLWGGTVGVLFLLLGMLLFGSTTTGGQLMSLLMTIYGLTTVLFTIILFNKRKKHLKVSN